MSYLARDFDTITDEVLKRIKSKYGDVYQDYAASSIGMMLVDVIAFTAESVAFYIDRRAAEAYLATAEEEENVVMLARQLGYYPRSAVPASTMQNVTLGEAYSFEVTLPVGFQFQSSGCTFETTEELVIPAFNTSLHTVSIREGVTRTVTVTSSGEADQQVSLGVSVGKYVGNDTVTVVVDGATWEVVDALSFEQSNQCEVLYRENPPYVQFGNGISGNIPPSGAEIRVTFVETSGVAGNVNGITRVVNPLYYGLTKITMTVAEASRASGGADPETVEEIRANAPGYAATRGVAVTKEDYFALASQYSSSQYGAVAVAQAYVAREVSGDLVSDSLITDIEGDVQTYIDATSADAAAVSGHCTSIQTSCTSVSSKVSLASGGASNISSAHEDAEAAVYEIEAKDGALLTVQTTLETYLAETSADVLTLDELITLMGASSDSSITSAVSQVEDIRDSLDSALTRIQDTRVALTASVGDAKTALATIASETLVVDANLTSITTLMTEITGSVTSISTLSDALPDTLDGYNTSIQSAVASLREHLTDVLAEDGKSNLITVPILSLDGDGYYIAPSNGLIRALEEHLQSKCDVAHLVRVVSGASAMVSVDITVSVKVLTGYVFSEISTQINTLLRSLLKRRKFGVDLYLSQVYSLIQAITGIDVFNVEFSSDDIALDSVGNVLVPDYQVVVPGTFTISQLS